MKKKVALKLLLIIIFALYTVFICYVLFVKAGSTQRSTYFINPVDHFIPFQGTLELIELAQQYNFQGYYLRLLITNIGGNLSLLLPFGFLCPLLFKTISTPTKVMSFAFLLSFSAELIQLIFSIGIFDVDDILYNIMGAALGFLFFKKLKAMPVCST
jgi:glycopeptide antibiotics resistance protein